jgi:hypothetical protein
VHRLQLGVVAEPAAGDVDGCELGGEQTFGGIAVGGLGHDDSGRGADGPKRTRRQDRLEQVGALHREDVPPDVTVGDEELVVGAEKDEDDDDDDVPVLPVVPVVGDVALPPLEGEDEPDVEPDVADFFAAPAPGWS